MQKEDNLQVIYIASIGHSGSTILDLFLETVEGALSAGEAGNLANACTKKGRRDDFDELLPESRVWGSFCRNINNYLSSYTEDHGRFEKALQVLLPQIFTVKSQYDNKKFLFDIKSKLEELSGQKINTLIDSSKDPHRMVALDQDKGVNAKLIHLIRSPWGVAYSHTKNNRGLLLGCWRWIRTNILIVWYLFWFADSRNYIRIFYEDFCAKPLKTSKRVTDKFNIQEVPDNYIEKMNEQTSYRFAGNALRHKEIKKIQEDKRWKKELPWYQKIVVGILCGPLYLFFKVFN